MFFRGEVVPPLAGLLKNPRFLIFSYTGEPLGSPDPSPTRGRYGRQILFNFLTFLNPKETKIVKLINIIIGKTNLKPLSISIIDKL